jgi:peptidyl-prolyl cis-trans isomerase D
MLQKLNERIRGVVAWIVIILIAMTFILFGVDYYMQSHQTSDIEVVVNGQPISKQAFEVNYRRNRQQRGSSKIAAISEVALKKQVLDEMVVNQVTVQAANLGGFDVSSKQANAAIINIPQFQQDGHFSAERYQQALSGAMFTPESFQKEVRQGMLLNQQRFAFIGSAFVLPAEINHFVKLYLQTRDYDYLKIPTNLFMDKAHITDDEVNHYYQTHLKEFIEPEKVCIDFIQLSMHKIREHVSVSKDEIKRYYDDNQTNFLTPIQWKVAHILFALPESSDFDAQNDVKQNAEDAYLALQNNPAQFSQWAKTLSSDKLSAMNDGILPWITAGDTEFDKALSTLTKIDQISSPIKTSHGYELFKLLAYRPASLKPLSQVESQILDQLITDVAQMRYTHALEQLTDLSYQTPDSLSPIADALNLPVEQTKPFSRAGGSTTFEKNKQIINMAFSHDVLELGNNSEPIQLDNDSVVVLRVNKHILADRKPLALVKNIIINKLALKNAETKAKDLGTQILTGNRVTTPVTKSDENPSSTVNVDSKQLVWHEVAHANRDTDKTDAVINDLAFSLSNPDMRKGHKLLNGDYVIVHLKKINDGHYEKIDKEQQSSIAQQIESSYGLMDYDLYVNSLVSQAKIDKHHL